MNTEAIANLINAEFGGVDQLKLVNARIDQMSREELKGLTLVCLNHLGNEMKGADYEGNVDATLWMSRAIQRVLFAYDDARMINASTNGEVGSA
jgi:hypothetical protein